MRTAVWRGLIPSKSLLILFAFIFFSALFHFANFYLFQVVYQKPEVHSLSRPAHLYLLGDSRPEFASLIRQIDARDPALFVLPRAEPDRVLESYKSQYEPFLVGRTPQLFELPPKPSARLQSDFQILGKLSSPPPANVPVRKAEPVSWPARPFAVLLETPGQRRALPIPPISSRPKGEWEPLVARVWLSKEGPLFFIEKSSGSAILDRSAMDQLRQLEPAEFGEDVAQPARVTIQWGDADAKTQGEVP